MPFKFAHVEWRYDTLVNTLILALVFWACTHSIVHQLNVNSQANQEKMGVVASHIDAAVNREDSILETMTLLHAKQEALSDQQQHTLDTAKLFLARLDKEKRR